MNERVKNEFESPYSSERLCSTPLTKANPNNPFIGSPNGKIQHESKVEYDNDLKSDERNHARVVLGISLSNMPMISIVLADATFGTPWVLTANRAPISIGKINTVTAI